MWDYTIYDFQCPYCREEYARTIGSGFTYKYKGKAYDWFKCPYCKEEFLGRYHEGVFIEMPEDKSELKECGVWMS